MNVEIVDHKKLTEVNASLILRTGRKEMQIFRGASSVTFIIDNAAHRVWRGSGKTFHGETAYADALKAYRSAEAKAMILKAQEILG